MISFTFNAIPFIGIKFLAKDTMQKDQIKILNLSLLQKKNIDPFVGTR